MLKSSIGFYSDFICNLIALKKLHVFKISFVSKQCSPCSKYSNQTGKICFIFFGFLFIFLRIFFGGMFKKNHAAPDRAEAQPSRRPISVFSSASTPDAAAVSAMDTTTAASCWERSGARVGRRPGLGPAGAHVLF